MTSTTPYETMCKRCKREPTAIHSRNDNFCKSCFIRFIRGKQRKQMQDERFKVKYGKNIEQIQLKTPSVLMALSLGESSLVLLDILVSLLEEQSNMTRAYLGFKLVVLVIDEEGLTENIHDVESRVEEIKQFFGVELLNSLNIKLRLVKPDSYINKDSLKNIFLTDDFQSFSKDTINNQGDWTIKSMLAQCRDKSTMEDFFSLVIEETILRIAVAEHCSVILFGHSMTKLADQTLALSVRGKGSEVSDKLTDGDVEFEGTKLHIIHPLRDVLFTEIRAYAKFSNIERFAISKKKDEETKKKSTRNKTINELIRDYFRGVEVDYPEVISTVVKIGSKLAHPPVQDDFQISKCTLCNNFIYNDPKHWLEQITVHGGAAIESDEDKELLSMYLKSVEKEEKLDDLEKLGERVTLCYGCIVNLNGSSGGFVWPTRRPTKQEILDQYVLTDDDDD